MGQIYFRNLHEEFFDRFPKNATHFLGVSGYVGPDPVRRLETLPLQSKIFVGLQNEEQNQILHKQLNQIHSEKVQIFYPDLLTHAKCYLWKNGNELIRGLIGSANFSINGLKNDYREILFEVEKRDLYSLNAYIEIIQESSRKCVAVDILKGIKKSNKVSKQGSANFCDLELYDRTGIVPLQSGLNWGFANANVNPNDAYIAIRRQNILESPDLFPRHLFQQNEGHRSRSKKESIEIIWDDGIVMPALFEGKQNIEGVDYPKQIASLPNKSDMGKYIRGRLGLPIVSDDRLDSERITREQLVKYGRDTIRLSNIQPGIYFCDFSN